MRCLITLLSLTSLLCVQSLGKDYVVYEGGSGPGEGKHVVLLTGDEEYRSEEALVQLGKILAFRHGFKATVLFAIDPENGTIDPNVNDSLPGAEQLDSADAIVMGLRFRRYPNEIMQHFVKAYLAGTPWSGFGPVRIPLTSKRKITRITKSTPGRMKHGPAGLDGRFSVKLGSRT